MTWLRMDSKAIFWGGARGEGEVGLFGGAQEKVWAQGPDSDRIQKSNLWGRTTPDLD